MGDLSVENATSLVEEMGTVPGAPSTGLWTAPTDLLGTTAEKSFQRYRSWMRRWYAGFQRCLNSTRPARGMAFMAAC